MLTEAHEPITVDGQKTTLRALVAAGKAHLSSVGQGQAMIPVSYHVVVHAIRPGVSYEVSAADFFALGGQMLGR
jgi:hypothetical protein